MMAWAAGLGVALGAAVPLGVAVALGVGVALGVDVGVGVKVGVGVGVVGVPLGVGVGAPLQAFGPRIATVTGVPALKKPIVAFVAMGGLSESNRKLYKVPHLMAFAF